MVANETIAAIAERVRAMELDAYIGDALRHSGASHCSYDGMPKGDVSLEAVFTFTDNASGETHTWSRLTEIAGPWPFRNPLPSEAGCVDAEGLGYTSFEPVAEPEPGSGLVQIEDLGAYIADALTLPTQAQLNELKDLFGQLSIDPDKYKHDRGIARFGAMPAGEVASLISGFRSKLLARKVVDAALRKAAAVSPAEASFFEALAEAPAEDGEPALASTWRGESIADLIDRVSY